MIDIKRLAFVATLALSILNAKISLTSPVFSNGSKIEPIYTCDGKDISMPLMIEGIPPNTRSIAILMEDPDAPTGIFTHWILYNLPPNIKWLPQDFDSYISKIKGAKEGRNDFGKIGYGGPCPPSGTHRYILHIYALDSKLSLHPGANREQFLEAIKGHVIDENRLMGKYSRK